MRGLSSQLLSLAVMALLLTSCNALDMLPKPPPVTPTPPSLAAVVPIEPPASPPAPDEEAPLTATAESGTVGTPQPRAFATPSATPRPANLPGGGNQPPVSSIRQIVRGPKGKHEVAITFDAGGGSGNIPAILQALRQRGLHITFFLTGKWVADNPDAARAIAADGHDIANHTYNHLHLPRVLSDTQVFGEITSAEAEIRNVTGVDARPYFRFPYGDFNLRTLQLVHNLGYTSVLWTFDSLDSVGKPKSVQFLVERVTHSKFNIDGAIVLMHIGNLTSAAALPTILDRLAAQGYHVVSIAELLR